MWMNGNYNGHPNFQNSFSFSSGDIDSEEASKDAGPLNYFGEKKIRGDPKFKTKNNRF